jgi:FkbM family methyltransferase
VSGRCNQPAPQLREFVVSSIVIGTGRIEYVTRAAIGRYRRSPVVKALHGLTSFVESAYANEGSNFESNGERFLLHGLRSANFRLAFDVGANLGDWLAEALDVWPNCYIHAFEVAPYTFQRLSHRVQSQPGHSDRVALNGAGVSDHAGVQQMYYFPEHPELTCDLPRHPTYDAIAFDAPMLILDDYCHGKSIDGVDFLKIDVEGAEHRVLKGFSAHLRTHKVQCIQFEYGAFSTQTRFLLRDYYSLLSPAYWIGKIYSTYVDFRDYHWSMEDFRFSNYCCVSRLRPDLQALLAA